MTKCEPSQKYFISSLNFPGSVLRTVMGDDLSSFRRMAKRVYDTMTQDVSDVLANEQINLTDYYNERYSIYMDKMMRSINEIYQFAPNFDFELYYEDPKEYLSRLFPLDVNVSMCNLICKYLQ